MNKILRQITLFMWLSLGIFSILMINFNVNTDNWIGVIFWFIPSQIILQPTIKYWKDKILQNNEYRTRLFKVTQRYY